MRIDVFTIFPAMVEDFAGLSLLGRAAERGLLDLRVHDLRSAATDPHRSVDDAPFGGGAGMVFMPEPVFAAVEKVDPPRPLYLLGPAGRRLDQPLAAELAGSAGFSLLCGRYEGVDERVRRHLVDGELSIGDGAARPDRAARWAHARRAGRIGERGWHPVPCPVPRRAPRRRRAMNPTDVVDQTSLRDDIPDFAAGDTLKVHVRVVEGNKERVQVFQGVTIRRSGSGIRETFTVRKVSYGVGVERTFPVHSPVIAKIEVVTRGDVRRAKLYYLRDRVGKAAKVKEKRT